jgi:hypothetical protein
MLLIAFVQMNHAFRFLITASLKLTVMANCFPKKKVIPLFLTSFLSFLAATHSLFLGL